MSFGFAPDSSGSASGQVRAIEPAEWNSAGIPLLRDPREVVKDLHARHLPSPSTAVVAVYDATGRLVASASFAERFGGTDGWEHRNMLLAHLRRVVPHDLRRPHPVRTAVLLVCREGESSWTEADGAWMWGLRDACSLHGLRCGAYITLTPGGWQVLGEGRSGRNPNSDTWAELTGRSLEIGPSEGAPQAVRRAVAR